MKNLTILVLLIASVLTANAQKIESDRVPVEVTNSFKAMFGTATVTGWELENQLYEATYMLGGTESAAIYQANGRFVQYENKVAASNVPEAARKYMATHYPNMKIVDYTQIKNVAGAISYEIDGTDADYLFDDKGNFISVEPETE
jgi:hypothetical protein